MKLFLRKLMAFFESVGYATAASRLANMGHIEEAKQLMLHRAKAKQTIKELRALSDKELNDIGIARYDIERIAYEKVA